MVRGRLIPTSYFRDPDVMSLSSGDVRLILVGLVLQADDYGRGLAHTVILGRDLDYPPEVIESALAELERAELVQCYQAGKHRYYVLTRWDDWQKLPEAKRTPSRLPAPPTAESASALSPEIPDFSGENPGNPEKPGGNPPESESNQNPSRIRIEDEEAQPPPNVLPFPAARADAADPVVSEKTVVEATKQVAAILTLPVTDDLARVVADYVARPGLSLLGEADAAVEWIADPKRNHKRQPMTPAFFRRWVKRETESAHRGYVAPGAPTTNTASRANTPPAQARLAANGAGPPGRPPADNQYHAFVTQRAVQVLGRARGTQQEETSHETPS
jgi:hypothetical protein